MVKLPVKNRYQSLPTYNFGEITMPLKRLLLIAFILSAPFRVASAADAPRPNIIVIMSDDMGYSDIGCYGSEISTPNLDALAAGGLRYTQFYNTGRCCPTRASLLTGLYAHQAAIGQMTRDFGREGYRGDLSRNAVTIAEVVKTAGYKTYMAGKWHVTKQLKPDGDKRNWPRQRGFDRFYGTIIGAGSFFDPWTLTRENTAITPDNDSDYQPEQYYYTDAISDNAVSFVDDHQKSGTKDPFFMYVAYTAAHWPMHALEKDIAKYTGKYDIGYEVIRKARYERMKALGVIKDWPLSDAPQAWKDIPEANKAWEIRCMEVYAAMIDNMDQGIGRIVKSLKASGQYENTLILFFQDNGGCSGNRGRRPSKPVEGVVPMGKDELQTDMVPRRSRDGHPVLTGPGVMPGPSPTYVAYGQNWANVSNTPFRQYKARVHEGGIATPMIAHWPKGIKAKNQLHHQVGHLIDIMATCVDLAGADYPKTYQGHGIPPMEGRSLAGTFAGNDAVDRQLMWEHYLNRAIRQGKWKLVALKNQPWELYDVEADRSELNNLAGRYPEKAKALAELWQSEAHRTKIYPKPGQRKKGKK
jgi:arylsulfatase